MEAVVTYSFQITFSFSISEVAITRKGYQPDGTFWNTVVLPGGPAYRCSDTASLRLGIHAKTCSNQETDTSTAIHILNT